MKYNVITTNTEGGVSQCYYPTLERAKQSAECESHVWENIKSVEVRIEKTESDAFKGSDLHKLMK